MVQPPVGLVSLSIDRGTLQNRHPEVVVMRGAFFEATEEQIRRRGRPGVKVLQTEDDDRHDWTGVCYWLITRVEEGTLYGIDNHSEKCEASKNENIDQGFFCEAQLHAQAPQQVHNNKLQLTSVGWHLMIIGRNWD